MAVNSYVNPGQTLSNEELGNFFSAMFTGADVTAPSATQGVFMHHDGGPLDQFVGAGATSPVSIGTGWAMVANRIIHNDAAVNVTVDTPAAAARKDRIILRYTWSTETADILLVKSAEGAADYASYAAYQDVDPSATVWCIPLYKVDIVPTTGAITLTDERDPIGGSLVIQNASIRDAAARSVIGRSAASIGDVADIAATADGQVLTNTTAGGIGFRTVSTAGLAADCVDNTILRNSAALSVIGRAENSAGQPDDISSDADGQVLRRSGTTIDFGTIGAAGIANDAIDSQHYAAGSIDLEHMSANSVDSDQYVDGSIDLAHMSANSVDSDQYVDGSIDAAHIAANAVGVAAIGTMVGGFLGRQGGNATNWHINGTTDYTTGINVRFQCGCGYGPGVVTFPVAFSAIPIVLVTPFDYLGNYYVSLVGASTFTLVNPQGAAFFWLAIGSE